MSKKAELLEAIAGKNRGLLASEIDNVRVLSAIQQLEDNNPTPRPIAANDLLEGDWRLLYTTSKGILGLDRFPLFKLGQIYQCIRTAEARVYNIAEVVGLPFLEGIVSVGAKFEPISEKRINVMFERSIIGLQRFFNYKSPDSFIKQIESGKKFLPIDFRIENRDRQGWLDITYLDEDMRIGRGNEGNVFVLTREKTALLR
ncbi:PAP fibrillin family protein [Hyella patelloides LEGE 07179]|uniref:PAP fibrillin family protein n=1 Tax=Hyella patelloides LEGE 07179 TaxID=945734 RepID=A0A563VQM9_9CYAN|nr:PAP/fibrillin family protein [Hyella patelloides]VEP13733.1 PAP fibrillin family protein [Hyella patelloides LEGE 07179]